MDRQPRVQHERDRREREAGREHQAHADARHERLREGEKTMIVSVSAMYARPVCSAE